MKKTQKNSKELLFENMAKLNPDFIYLDSTNLKKLVNESEDKWIQKAVNPEHKGFCSPESKPTCTPARKALAKRFKKGIDEEYTEATPEELKIKAERIKAAIDELVTGNDEFGIIRTLYKLLVERKKASGIPQPAITSEVAEVKEPKIS